jgi:7-carboxy-7-deazaguanine synthase
MSERKKSRVPWVRVHEIFKSVNGEVTAAHQGSLTTFVRLQRCNLRCAWCDTAKAQGIIGGKELLPFQVADAVQTLGVENVTVTGGEPLVQGEAVQVLIRMLKARDHYVTVETNGSYPIWNDTDDPQCWVVDYKTKSSGMNQYMKKENFEGLGYNDFIKAVVSSPEEVIDTLEFTKGTKAKVAFSPAVSPLGTPHIPYKDLVDLLYEHGAYKSIINVQLHKIIGVA